MKYESGNSSICLCVGCSLSRERCGEGPGLSLFLSALAACSHRVLQSLRASSQPVQTCLSLSESSFLTVAIQECFHWWLGEIRDSRETKRELSILLYRCGPLCLSAQIPKTSLTRFVESTTGSLWGGRVQWVSEVFLRSSGRGQILPSSPQQGQELLVKHPASWSFIYLHDYIFHV